MIFNLFSNKKNIKELRKDGGMEKKYSELISKIKLIGQTNDQRFNVMEKRTKEDIYEILIDFSGMKDMAFAYQDNFLLMDKGKELLLEWTRYSQGLIIPPPIPKKINHKMYLNNNLATQQKFDEIINSILSFLANKHSFSDLHYELIKESGTFTYISKKEIDRMSWDIPNIPINDSKTKL